MSSITFAQTNDNSSFDKTLNAKNAKVFSKFEIVPNGQLGSEFDSFFVELQNNPDAQGYVINYGTKKDVGVREKSFRNHLIFRRYDHSRIVIVNGGFRGEIKTVLWIVPQGAEPPTIESASKKIDEFVFLPNGEMKSRLYGFLVELQNNPSKKAYIVTTGATKAILRREKFIKNYLLRLKSDSSRIKFFNDGFSDELKTELWIDL